MASHSTRRSIALRRELTEMFGGVTAFNRAPALDETKDDGDIVQDSIVIFEVMVDDVDYDLVAALPGKP